MRSWVGQGIDNPKKSEERIQKKASVDGKLKKPKKGVNEKRQQLGPSSRETHHYSFKRNCDCTRVEKSVSFSL